MHSSIFITLCSPNILVWPPNIFDKSMPVECRTWCWLLIIPPKSVESARAAMVLKVGAGRNLTPSRPTEKTFQEAQDGFIQDTPPSSGYNILASVVAWVASCRTSKGIPRDRKVLSANVDEEHEPRMLLKWSETDSKFSYEVTPTVHCWWVDEMGWERTDHPPLYA